MFKILEGLCLMKKEIYPFMMHTKEKDFLLLHLHKAKEIFSSILKINKLLLKITQYLRQKILIFKVNIVTEIIFIQHQKEE